MKKKIVCASGGFDPLHIGHLRHLQHAAIYGDLVVILNSDGWLQRKKGFVFMPWEERAELLMAYSFIKDVVPVKDDDGTVMEALRRINPDFYAKGGDRKKDNTPEVELCGHLGIETLWGIGGDDKLQASSRLVEKAIQSKLVSRGII